MAIDTWVPAVTTTGILSLALWLGRNLIATRLTKSVEHAFNTKLEANRAEHRKTEEQLRADLRAREAQIDALQSGALAAMLSRQQAVDKKWPFVSAPVWASYAALSTVCAHGVMRHQAIKAGIPGKGFDDTEAVNKLIVAALPHYKDL